jgi:hypothetical protein
VQKLRVLGVVVVSSLVFACSAFAYDYAGYQSWSYLESYDSTYSTGWYVNVFAKDSQGFDTTVTFIDATGYNWHNTVRNILANTGTGWGDGSETRKAHCLSHTSGFFGRCIVTT